jgi:hypothetical protein
MSIDSTTLSEARKRGYTDEEIYSKLIQNEPSFSEVQKRGYTLDEIAQKTDSKITQGGEQNEQSQPEANTDSDEQRQANEQVQPPNEAGVQASSMRLPKPQGEEQPVGNIDPNLTATTQATTGGDNRAKTEQAPEGSQGQETGEGLRSQVPSGNEAEVNSEGVPSAPEIPTISARLGAVDKLKQGDIGGAAGDVMESIGRAMSPLMGPTQKQRFEESVPVKMPDGSTQYKYKPMGDRLAQEGGIFTPFLEIEQMQPNKDDSLAQATGKAVFNTLAGLEGSILSPVGVLLPAASEVPIMSKAVSAGFGAQMLFSVPEQIGQAIHGETAQERMQGVLGALTGLVFGGAAAKHVMEPVKVAPSVEIQKLSAEAEQSGLPETAKVVPEAITPVEPKPTVEISPTGELKEATDIVTEPKATEAQKPTETTTEAEGAKPKVKEYPPDTSEEIESIYKTAEDALAAGDTEAATLSLNAAKEAELNPENSTSMEGQEVRKNRWNDIDEEIENLNAKEKFAEAPEAMEVADANADIDLSGSIEARDILGFNASKAFKYIENNKNTPEPFRQLARVLAEFAGNKKLGSDIIRRMPEKGEEGFTSDMEGALGMRKKTTSSILIPKGKVEVATVIHEGLHTLTQDEIDIYVKHYEGETGYKYLERLNEALANEATPDPIKRLINLYKLTLINAKDGKVTAFETYFDNVTGKAGKNNVHDVYGFKDLHEFVAEAFTNKEFQDILKNMRGDGGKTIWQNFIDAVSAIFNIPKGSMLESVMDASLSISKIERESPAEVQKRFSRANNLSKETAEVAKEMSAVFSKKSDPNKWRKRIEKVGMFRDDLEAMGVEGVAKEIAEEGKQLVPWLVKAGTMTSDFLEGRIIPNLTRAGVKLAAVVHAQAKKSIDPVVKDIISQVFPEKYQMSAEGIKVISDIEWSTEKLEREQKRLEKYGSKQYSKSEYATMMASVDSKIKNNKKLLEQAKDKYDLVRKPIDIIVKDNILGGADIITEEIAQKTKDLEALRASEEDGTGGRGIATKIKNAEQLIVDLNDSLESIKKIHDLDKYAKDVEAAKGTDIEKDIQRWKEVVNPIMDDLYKRANNTTEAPQTERGRVFGARINLLAEWEANKFMEMESMDGPPIQMMGVDYRNPDIKADRLAKKAAFNTEYSTDVEAILKNSLTSRTNEATKLDFYKALLDEGVAIFADPNDKVTELKGKPVQRMEFEMPVKTSDGTKIKLENRSVWIQTELYKEVKQILDMTERGEQNPFAQGSTMMQLVGIADMVAHLKNLHSAVANALGRDTHAADVASKIPFMSSISAVKEIFSVVKEMQMDGPKIRAEKAELARLSGLRPHYDQTGIMRLLTKHQHDLLHETDIASRIIMARRYKNLVERFGAENTPEAKIDFVNQIGEYNRRLMARWEASLRDSGWSPFIVAGRAMNRMARRLVTARTGFKARDAKAQLQARAIQASGLVMATVLPAMINLMTTGSMFGRNGTPIGAIDFGPNFDTSDGKRRIFDLFQMVGIRRGLRQLGINALVEGWRSGLSYKEIQKNVGNDMWATSLHPIIGPGLGLAYSTLTGKRLDMRVGFSDIYTSRKVGGLAQYVENFRTGLKQQNELLYSTPLGYAIEKGMEMGGIPRPMEQNESETMRDLGIPNVPVVKQLFTAGVTAAGAFGAKLSVSPALKLSAQLGSKQQYTPQQDIRYNYRKEILKAVADKDIVKAKQIYQKGLEENVLTKADDKTLKGKITQPDLLIQRTSRLKTAEDALSVFRVADAEEQDKIALIVYKKIAGSSAMNKQEAKDLFEEFKKVAKKGTKAYNRYNK